MNAVEFCDICGVRMDMHNLAEPDPCEAAQAEADRIERVERLMFGWVGQ
jgi:hypothetical protein